MKNIYVDKETFICFMEPSESRIEVQTDVFDGMSDNEIECYRFVPNGYRWIDPDGGDRYTGQHVMPVNYGRGGSIRTLQANFENIAEAYDTTRQETVAALNDVYAALTELAELVV